MTLKHVWGVNKYIQFLIRGRKAEQVLVGAGVRNWGKVRGRGREKKEEMILEREIRNQIRCRGGELNRKIHDRFGLWSGNKPFPDSLMLNCGFTIDKQNSAREAQELLYLSCTLTMCDRSAGRYSTCHGLYDRVTVVDTHEHRSSDIHHMNKLIMVRFISQSSFSLAQNNWILMKFSKTNITLFISGD